MPYSDMFTDSAARRARVFEEVAVDMRQARLLEMRAIRRLSELRDEPDKILAQGLVEAVRVDPHQAYAMLRAATAITETLTPTGHTTPAPLPTVRDAAGEGAIGVGHIAEIAKVMADLPTRISVQERESVETALTATARLHPPVTVKQHGQKLLAHLEQDGGDPGDDGEQTEPANTMTYRRSRTGRVKIVAELDAETAEVFEGMILPLAKPKKLNEDTPDPRDKRRRQGDAMSEVIYRAAGHGKDDRAVKADLIVTLDLNMLTDGVAGATLDGGAVLPPSAVRRLACDAGCAMWRSVISPTELGGIGGIFLGLMTYLDLKGEGDRSMSGNQRACPGVGALRWGTRVIWRKLDCLNPNLQETKRSVRRKDV